MKTNETMAKNVIEKSSRIIAQRKKKSRLAVLFTVIPVLAAAIAVFAVTVGAQRMEKTTPVPNETTAVSDKVTEDEINTIEETKEDSEATEEKTTAVYDTEAEDEIDTVEETKEDSEATEEKATAVSDTEPEDEIDTIEEAKEGPAATEKETTSADISSDVAETTPRYENKDIVWADGVEDQGIGEWYGKTIYGSLNDYLYRDDPQCVLAIRFVPYIEREFVYNGKTYEEYEKAALDELEEEILAKQRYDAFMQYAEMYISIGSGKVTDYGEYNWKKTWYDGMTEFFGEDFLSAYIENETPLYEKLKEDFTHLPTGARDERDEARTAYLKTALQEVTEMLISQNIEYSVKTDSIVIFVTVEEFRSLDLGKYSQSCFQLASRFGSYDDM